MQSTDCFYLVQLYIEERSKTELMEPDELQLCSATHVH